MNLPGCTDLSSYTKLSHPTDLRAPSNIIILATNEFNDTSIFVNGLTQNILILYDLFECIGYKSYLLQYNHTQNDAFLSKYNIITPPELLAKPIDICSFIEIGMSVNAEMRSYLRSNGAKIIKLYLGNILNIDIETIQNFNSVFFYHHIVGEIDAIWTSPHYKQHMEYASILNRTKASSGRIVPYVWDSCFISHYASFEWIPSDCCDIVIMDPNISFQKSYFYSLLLVEAFSKKYPQWNGKVHIINGDKIDITPHSQNVIPSLSIKNKMVIHGRKNINTILKENRSACFITHQWNNDFNYMTLELMYCNYPILHNSEGWRVGYHYDINKWNDAIQTLYNAVYNHKKQLNVYKSHTANLIWKHSIHNPDIQAEWRSILAYKD